MLGAIFERSISAMQLELIEHILIEYIWSLLNLPQLVGSFEFNHIFTAYTFTFKLNL